MIYHMKKSLDRYINDIHLLSEILPLVITDKRYAGDINRLQKTDRKIQRGDIEKVFNIDDD